MNTSKSIDISKSSLVGLKAELLKKQEEVKKLKELQQDHVKPVVIQKKKSVQQKSNKGVEERCLKDSDSVEKDYNVLQKSREVLEAKSRLYDRLKQHNIDEQTKSKYLIDFDLKRDIEESSSKNKDETTSHHSEDEEEDFSDYNSDPENDWVDFVDTLGRSRRCLRKDLLVMKAKDAKLAKALNPPSPPPTPQPAPELLSWDMQREMMRKKWEEQETMLLGKTDVHYQDIRFDEARPHGVGYFEFSTEEAERIRQQQELQKLRTETVEQQQAAQGLRARRQQQLQARLAAARQRKRERLGLPPESPPHEAETPTTDNEGEHKEDNEEENINELEESIKKIAPVRPWDIGKDGVKPVMSQEEWVEMKRQERPEEFAPPVSLVDTTDLDESSEKKWKANPNVFTSKKKGTKPFFLSKYVEKTHTPEDKNETPNDEEEENYGPSVEDWKQISQQTGLSESDNVLGEARGYSSTRADDVSVADSREDIPGPTTKDWKPSIADIDLLLSKTRAGFVNTSATQENKIQNSSQHPIISSEVQEERPLTNLSAANATRISTEAHYTGFPDKNSAKETFDNFTSKRVKKQKKRKGPEMFTNPANCETVIKPIINLLQVDSDDEEKESSKRQEVPNQQKHSKRKYTEIPPPPSMSYYIDPDNTNQNKTSSTFKLQAADSVSAGLNYLKTRSEEKSNKRLKGMLDFI